MTLEELKAKIEEYNIPPNYYSLNEVTKENAIILERIYDDWWEVYFLERGTKTDPSLFLSAEQAYDNLWKHLSVDPGRLK